MLTRQDLKDLHKCVGGAIGFGLTSLFLWSAIGAAIVGAVLLTGAFVAIVSALIAIFGTPLLVIFGISVLIMGVTKVLLG